MENAYVSQILDQLDAFNATYVTKGYEALVSGYGALMTTVIVIYIAWIGWKTLNHWDGFSAGNFVKQALKIGVIYSIATDWGFFSQYIYNVLTNGPNEISMVLMKAAGGHYDSTNSALNELFIKGLETGSKMWNKSGFWSSMLGCVFAIDIWIFTIVVTCIAVVMIGIAKVFLASLIVLAPVFVYFLLSDSFKGITESWFRLTFGFALVPLMVNTALLYTNEMLKTGMDRISKAVVDGEVCDAITSIALFDIGVALCCVLLWKSANLASQIGGGLAINTLNTVKSLNSVSNPLTGISSKLMQKASGPAGVLINQVSKTASNLSGRWQSSKKG